ncbi:hypothetical protein SDC9_111238 [bioreactor metagenome]|uniref:Uncharacterized protein n=1 Tax=bioreactor metagenome TaxID=1076179 RepID=A0A645BG86_9ZZZZ
MQAWVEHQVVVDSVADFRWRTFLVNSEIFLEDILAVDLVDLEVLEAVPQEEDV